MLRFARQLSLPLRCASRSLTTAAALPSDAFTKNISHARIANAVKLMHALSPEDRYVVESMLRVDHSGEIAANTIYEAQADVFGVQGKSELTKLILEMWENEKKHLEATSNMLDEYRVRPSALTPVWALAGRVLGGVTAALGPKSAMACTEAVETVIGEHYDE
ncbi:Putative ubiquinone biosynthesis monooxygenase [Malassezia cuniculi]|uniref:Ubiquinone biosynthesis monooxygenase n=1 Tax=Malassezia cuniculi TaxID=948313 RepID=A0AAF0EQF9_9BASI|nr:Putative ubiquinone biosynthesis monooxygenase [Malassezia cuniculi]